MSVICTNGSDLSVEQPDAPPRKSSRLISRRACLATAMRAALVDVARLDGLEVALQRSDTDGASSSGTPSDGRATGSALQLARGRIGAQHDSAEREQPHRRRKCRDCSRPATYPDATSGGIAS
jgi:hypothetical protein